MFQNATKDCSKNTCLEDYTGEHVKWKQVFPVGNVMIGYKRSIPARLECLQALMEQGSPLCDQLGEQIVQKF